MPSVLVSHGVAEEEMASSARQALIFFFFKKNFAVKCINICVCAPRVCLFPRESKAGVSSLGTGLTEGCEWPYGC